MPAFDHDQLEKEVLGMGQEIFNELNAPDAGIFRSEFYAQKLMAWGMRDEEFKVALFRFVDVLPSLPNAQSVISHVNEYFVPLRSKVPAVLRKGLDISPSSIFAKLAAATIRRQVGFVAANFIVGDTPANAMRALRRIRRRGQAFTVDLLGEAPVSESEALIYQARYLDLLKELAEHVPNWPEAKPISRGHRGEQTAINISVKPSSLYSQARPIAHERSRKVIIERLGQILSDAKKNGAFVYIDMEDSSLTSITLESMRELFCSSEFRSYDRLGIVLQAYMRRTTYDLENVIAWTKKRGTPIAIRLVKGAYWDTEVLSASAKRWPIPVWQRKENSDANYEALALQLIANHEVVMPAFASHNVRSLCFAIKAAETAGLTPKDFELQMLYGMAGPMKIAFSRRGYLVREYAPVGEILPGMAYLVRRLLENTSNEGFLRQSQHEDISSNDLLKKPVIHTDDKGDAHTHINPRTQFVNVAYTDFSVEEERQIFANEIARQQNDFRLGPTLVRTVIDGRAIEVKKHLFSVAPEDAGLVLGKIQLADVALAKRALDGLAAAFDSWRATSVSKRAELLFRTAEILTRRRTEFAVAAVLEAGKPWAEADADVAEAIDFLNYYAHEALRIFVPQNFGSCPGENNTYFYEPRGVAVVISPWNFPVAIPCGMFAAALVAGNTVLLKPAEQTSITAKLLFDAFLEAGMPGNVAALLPAIGEEVGPTLIEDPRVATVVFTGSKAVGLKLLREGANHSSSSEHVKRVITEMGGKNAIIIDEDADLDEAVRGVVYSAFGYQGQKCSACSRAIIVGGNYQRVIERLAEAVKSIEIGPPSNPNSFLGPVIDEEAFERISKIISQARIDCKVVAEGNPIDGAAAKGGFYVTPIAFGNIPDGHFLLTEEIFGPVLAVQKATDFSEALNIANAVEYGLTGGVFSRSPANIERAKREFRVGNLYINRGCTGAVVKRHPFGGAKMSGVGSKAGGPDYLLQFTIPRAVSENTIRRGFAPTAASGE